MSDRKQPTPEQIRHAQIEHTLKRLMDQQRLIEAGWATYRKHMSADAPPIQLRECRLAFWNGALFLFESIMRGLDAGAEPTDDDDRRMDGINNELRAFNLFHHELLSKKRPTWTCSRCGALTFDLKDICLGYCTVCRDWA